jgi:hypothetical protein
MTANNSVPMPPAGMSGTACVQVVPGGLPSGHDQPGVLSAASKVTTSGTVSVTTTPVAGPLPTLR